MSKELAKLYAKRFIQRQDIKAVQFANGKWSPDTEVQYGDHGHGFDMASLLRHLDKRATYGHYLLDDNSMSKLFVFDIDLEQEGSYCKMPGLTEISPFLEDDQFDKHVEIFRDINPREIWQTRKNATARAWYKLQMRTLAQKFTKAITELGVECAAAYSGSKGLHVYGFTGSLPAAEVREGAMLVLDIIGDFEPSRGSNFFRHQNLDPIRGFPNFSVEVFPKQDNLDGKSLGNLVRLPLGVNQKSPRDPAFFLDLKAPMGELRQHPNPIELLTSGNAYI